MKNRLLYQRHVGIGEVHISESSATTGRMVQIYASTRAVLTFGTLLVVRQAVYTNEGRPPWVPPNRDALVHISDGASLVLATLDALGLDRDLARANEATRRAVLLGEEWEADARAWLSSYKEAN